MQVVEQLLQQLVNGLSLGALYALIAVGYTVVYGIIQLINFAHGEVFMIGAFSSLTVWLALFKDNTALWVFPFMILGAIGGSVGIAVLMERVAYRPLRNAPRLAPLITAIGVSVFLQEAVRLFYGEIPGFPSATSAIPFPQIDVITGPAINVAGVDIQRASIFTLGALIICTAFLYYFINKTKTGRAMQATSQDPDTARLMGINVDRIIVIAFALGGALAAIAGIAHGLINTNIDFRMGFLAGLKAFTAAVLGGIGNINGAVVGGLVLGLVETMATQYIPGQFGGSAWKDVWAFAILILVLVFRPQGLLGARVVDRA
ncbi:branched-chain amino acid ABC transporter permease [Fodinicola acaciae]|uniref:branched-chain amino acid ABC transporter permease n=1 Tax=Fodinicola acaciae TaxID=2681555 RepID=UPI001C9E3A21|nr:branched-chain amino acid ABC transporter permease [Fodinicola acaciae]